MEQQAADLAMLDSLTGLWNRRALLAALRERVPSGRGAIVLLDLDRFKSVVEGVGSENADRILLDVAGRLLSCLEGSPLLYRYAGDAFALLVPDGDHERGAAVAETLRSVLAREPLKVQERLGPAPATVSLTASAGVAAYPTDARSPAMLIEAVERALLVAKRTGRNRVAVAGRLDPAALAEIGIFRGLPCPIFVGRAPEQSRLRQLAASAREVGPALALISGPPGIGKSRLLQELCRWARGERFVVLGASCPEPRTYAPYATLLEQIERAVAAERAQTLAAFERLTPAHRAAIASLTRALPRPAPAPPEPDPAERGRIMFEAFGALFDELARIGPLLVAMDEVECADEGSLEVYRAALERRLPLYLVATADRSGQAFDATAAGEFFREHERIATRLPLGPLGPEEMRQMLSAILPPDADVSPDTVEQLVVASGGSPLYLEETVRTVMLKGRLRVVEGRWTLQALAPADLPKDVEGAVRAALAALPAGANWLLARAAVIGGRVDTELLQEVLGQREAETLDFIDEARRARLLLAGEGEEEVLSFPAAHARRVRLDATDAIERRVIHGRVGVVQEARHGGDTAHLAEELAYHYGRAGEEARAAHFDALARRRAMLIQPPRKRGARRARLAPVTEPLSAPAQEHALAFLRHFAAVVKIRRLYPQWSQVSVQFMEQLRAALGALVAAAPGLTVAATPSGPTLNGAASTVIAVADFVALLDDRLVESMTVLRGFEPARLDRVVDGFVVPFDRLRAAPDHWDRFLNRENLQAVDIVQKAFEAQRTQVHAVARHGDEPIPHEHLPAVRDALRFFKAAVDSLKLYPPGHPLVEETAAQASRSLIDLVAKVPAITVGTVDGELIINRMAADQKFFGDAGAWLAREIDLRELKSISIWQGLVDDEVRALVSSLSMPGREFDEPGVREALLAQFRHIAMASLRYERATSEGREAEEEIHPPPKPIRAELRARAHLARPYDKFLTMDLEHEFPILVEALTYGAGRPLAEQLVDRLGDHFHDGAVAHRRKAVRLMEMALAYASPGTRQLEIKRSGPPLRLRLAEDTGPLQFQAAANLLPVWIPAALTAGCLAELAEIAAQTLRKRADAPDTPPDIRKQCESALAYILEVRAFERILAAVRRPPEPERRAAIDILMAIGGPARRELVRGLVEEPDAGVRRGLAAALAAVAELLAGELAAILGGGTPVDRLVRALEVVDALQAPSLAVPLAALLDHGTPAVRREVMRAARAGPRVVTLTVARRLLSSGAEDRQAGLEMAGAMKLTEVSAEIGRILEETADEQELVRCCRYFAAAPNMAVVGLLAEIARTRPRLFGLVKGYRAETRAAAAMALAAQGSAQAQEALAEAIADPEVRALAKM